MKNDVSKSLESSKFYIFKVASFKASKPDSVRVNELKNKNCHFAKRPKRLSPKGAKSYKMIVI